jgi:hypothetical protein
MVSVPAADYAALLEDRRQLRALRDGSDPVTATVSGVPVVTLPAGEYAKLLEDRRRLQALTESTAVAPDTELRQRAVDLIAAVNDRRFLQPPRSRIEGDQEVAVFLAERFGRMTLKAILAECRDRFGSERTPPMSSAHRFWDRLRKSVTGRKRGGK